MEASFITCNQVADVSYANTLLPLGKAGSSDDQRKTLREATTTGRYCYVAQESSFRISAAVAVVLRTGFS